MPGKMNETDSRVWELLEQAQLHLERTLEKAGARFDHELGTHQFEDTTKTAAFGGVVQASVLISDAQGLLEHRHEL